MSLSNLTTLAVARDLTAAGAPLTDAAMSAGRGTVAPAADANAPAPPLAEGQVDAVAGSPQNSGQPPSAGAASFTQLLVAQIPSEALVAYTTLLALFSAGTDGSYNIGRWILYSVTLLVCAITVLANYLSRRTYALVASPTGTPAEAAPPTAPGRKPGPLARIRALHLPYLPASAAVLAMAVYGLTVPGSPLQSNVSHTAFAILSGCLAVGGGVMMSIIAPFLGKGNGMTPAQRRS